MKTIKSAVLTVTQVEEIQKLFESFGRTFHIQPVIERGDNPVWVNIFCNAICFGNGWDKNITNAKPFGFDSFFESCHEELTKRFKLIE